MENKKSKILIVCVSVHKGNTLKVAERMAGALGADLKKPNEVDMGKLDDYGLIGFGSGIYAFRHHKQLMNLVEKLPKMKGKKAFVFSTAGMARDYWHKAIKGELKEKDFEIVGEFNCKGWDEFGPYKLIGGMNKGRPNEDDLNDAEEFAKGLLDKV